MLKLIFSLSMLQFVSMENNPLLWAMGMNNITFFLGLK